MPKSTKPESGEWLQIATLTFAMTGGGFALVLLLLKFFLVPDAQASADRAERDYEKLSKELLKPATKDLRDNAKRAQGQDVTSTLEELIKQGLDANGVTFAGTLPAANVKKSDRGPEERRIKLTTEPAGLQSLVDFVAAVEQKKKTIQVETVEFKRDPRAKDSNEDSWTCVAEFVDYVARTQ